MPAEQQGHVLYSQGKHRSGAGIRQTPAGQGQSSLHQPDCLAREAYALSGVPQYVRAMKSMYTFDLCLLDAGSLEQML